MFDHVERADAGETLIGERELFPVINLAALGEFPGPFDVWLGDIDAVCLETRFRKPRHDLAHAATDIQGGRAWFVRFQRVGILGIEPGVPPRQKFRVGLVAAITFLVAHPDGTLRVFWRCQRDVT